MKLEWDEAKRKANLRKHGLDFADAHKVFQGPLRYAADLRNDYGEERWQGIGLLNERVVVVIFLEPEPDIIRIISLRRAKQHERIAFEAEIADRLGEG